MIVVRLHGGLGNQMFQYALGCRLAHDKKTLLKIDISGFINDPRPYALNGFRIMAEPAAESELKMFKDNASLEGGLARLKRLLPFRQRKLLYVRERQFHFDLQILDSPSHSYFDGYWQSEKYFGPVAKIVREQFRLVTPMSASRLALADLIKGNNAVSVHVRRGDYVADPQTLAYHGTCAPEWYERAMALMAESVTAPHFFAFSDDPEWARANLPQCWPIYFVDPQNDKRDAEDMHLMASCRHHITANSSFSWWGAWLNPSPDKRVIVPRRWFDQAPINTCDLVPLSMDAVVKIP